MTAVPLRQISASCFWSKTFRIILYALWGIITFDICRQALMLIPFMLFGLVLGMLSGKILDEKIVKKLVIIMLMISGVALILNSL